MTEVLDTTREILARLIALPLWQLARRASEMDSQAVSGVGQWRVVHRGRNRSRHAVRLRNDKRVVGVRP